MLLRKRTAVVYAIILTGFPVLVLDSYFYGLIYADLISLIWFIGFFEFLVSMFLLIHLDYLKQEDSISVLPNTKDIIKLEEEHLTQNAC